ncbi:AbrB family transcriptional regulator [Ornithinibacillus californiensis]|uniref:AbrB family transcriptional regulator n=1 Tax=Ornithinibacillus californiensis TaxID=161536 RepID=UPI00064DFD11|nr:AbrB family transcriptional regulator [Ornithinibacillus californiensis]
MSFKVSFTLVEAAIISILGGYVFSLLHIPLPWVLGPLTFVMLWQGFTGRRLIIPNYIRDAGFIILGIYFGLYFTTETIQTVIPYLLPYILVTCILIIACIMLGTVVTRWIQVDKITSVFSCIPGGLSEMAIAGESLKANASLIVIFQTIRLVTVLFTIPPFMVYFIGNSGDSVVQRSVEVTFNGSDWSYLWFILPVLAAIFFRNKIPAGIIIGALGITAVMNISPLELASVPSVVMNAGQVAVGASLGKNILFQDLKVGGKYTFVYFGLSLMIVTISFGLGMLLAAFTSLDLATALLGTAPGGFFEMVLTAYNVGGDPAIVSALQLVRILLIVLLVPISLKWWFSRKTRLKRALT